MIPEYLRVSGFLSYKEQVELDFSSFDLACITGANGAGKSSILDAITWALFGQARRRDEAVINSQSDEAEVWFDFFYENDVYRVVRGKARGKSTRLEFFVRGDDGDWRTITERSMRETETRIQEILSLDYETFINASFFLQGKADQFAQQRPGDRKRILGSILGLEIWETYRERAVSRRRMLEKEMVVIDSRLEEIVLELAQEEQRVARLAQLEHDLEQQDAVRQAKESVLENLRNTAVSLEERRHLLENMHKQLEASRARLMQQKESLQQREQEREAVDKQLGAASEIEAAYQQWQESRQELERWDEIASHFRQYEAKRSEPLLAIESERSRLSQELQGLSTQQSKVNDLKQEYQNVQAQLKTVQHEVSSLQQACDRQGELDELQQQLMEKQAAAQAENRQLKYEMNEIKARIDTLKDTEGVACPLCGQELQTDERIQLIENLEKQGKTMGDHYRENTRLMQEIETEKKEKEEQRKNLEQAAVELRQKERLLDSLENRKKQIAEQVDEWQSSVEARFKEVENILQNETYAQEARVVLAEVDEALKELGYDAAAHDAAKTAEKEGRSSEEAIRSLEASRAAVEPLEKMIAEIKQQIALDEKEIGKQEDVYRDAEEKFAVEIADMPDLVSVEKELFDIQEKVNRLRMDIGGARQEVEVLAFQREKQKEYDLKREQMSRQVSLYKTIERAFSKDGVPALLIEQALPEIEEQANNTLELLTAGNMTVSFITQADYKDRSRDDKKETLDILINDVTGEQKTYEMFSGGEAFRINFAIRLALSRVLAKRAGAKLQTLVIDEGFGSQDAEGRQRLVEAINIARKDFAKILVITHLEELKEIFPARIEVQKQEQGSSVEVVVL